MLARSVTEAMKQARLNADYFGVPFVVFYDTSGNVRVESQETCSVDGCVVIPNLKERES